MMKTLLTVVAVAISQSVFAADKGLTKEESPKVIEAKIRKQFKKPTGELAKSDYEKVTMLFLKPT